MNTVTIENNFIRERNILITQADFSLLLQDLANHLKENSLEMSQQIEQMFRSSLAIFSMHLSAHPRNEQISWTINFQDPLLNLFLVGDTATGEVAGRVFTENVKVDRLNSFYQEIHRRNKEPRQSFVDFEGHDPFLMVERFYQQSEQRPARFFQLDENRFIMFGAHPDYDREWFASLAQSNLESLLESETIVPLEKRPAFWFCGCSQQKLIEILSGAIANDVPAFFEEETTVTANCPRCQAHYTISQDQVIEQIEKNKAEVDETSSSE